LSSLFNLHFPHLVPRAVYSWAKAVRTDLLSSWSLVLISAKAVRTDLLCVPLLTCSGGWKTQLVICFPVWLHWELKLYATDWLKAMNL
jgi:hypothetical protein